MPRYNFMLAVVALLGLASIAVGQFFTDVSDPVAASFSSRGFIRVQGERFVDENCREFFFTGWNSWALLETAVAILSMPEEATIVRDGKNAIEWMFDEARRVGFNMLRLFGHGVEPETQLQRSPGQYNELVFEAYDYILHEAGRRGIKLIISFGNNWGEVDSKSDYVAWADDATTQEDFFTKDGPQRLYKRHMKAVVTRRNTFNGLLYRDDPTIFAWNLINEQRCTFCESETNEWIKTMSAYLKTVDPNHMVTTGQEGFYNWGCPLSGSTRINPSLRQWQHTQGQDFLRNHAAPSIDFAVIHLWPDNWNIPEDREFPLIWIREHVQDAAIALKKPLVLEEFGIVADNNDEARATIRDPVFRDVFNEVLENVASGGPFRAALFWEWRTAVGGEPGKHGISDSDSTWPILEEHAMVMGQLNAQGSIVPECEAGIVFDLEEAIIPQTQFNTTSCCDEDCHAVHADLKGETFEVSTTDTAGECCRACKLANVRAGRTVCTTWSYCPCGACNTAAKGECRLKTKLNPFYPESWQSGLGQPWLSGTLGETVPEWRCQPTGFCAFDENCPNFGESLVCADPGCNPAPRTLRGGEVLVVSTNSIERPWDANNPPDVTSAAQCCQKCREHEECNGWQYCPFPEGCSLYLSRCDQNRDSLGMGPFDTCPGDGKNWPQHMCQLLKVDSANPDLDQLTDHHSWVSGVLKDK